MFVLVCCYLPRINELGRRARSGHARRGRPRRRRRLAEEARLRQQRLHLRLLARLRISVASVARVQVRASARTVGLTAIAPEDGVGRNTSGALGRLHGGLRVSGRPLLVVALLLLANNPLGGLLGVAAEAVALTLEFSRLQVHVQHLALLHLVVLEAVGASLLLLLHLDEPLRSLLRRLSGQGRGVLGVGNIAPEATLVQGLHQVPYSPYHEEVVGAGLTGAASEVITVHTVHLERVGFWAGLLEG